MIPKCHCQANGNTLVEQLVYVLHHNLVQKMKNYSDYIVYVDESCDHNLVAIDRNFPVFALSFCIFAKEQYANCVVPATQEFKFHYWGHDAVVLHEREIRKSIGDFAFPRVERRRREQFITDLNDLIASVSFDVIGAVIQKNDLIDRDENPPNPYNIALRSCMNELLSFLLKQNQQGRLVHVVLERRGKKEDQDLEREFQDVAGGISQMGFEPKLAPKSTNSTGLQFADLTARPMAQHILRPLQRNRPFKAIEDKLVSLKRFPVDPE